MVNKGMESEHQKPMIWCLKWLIFIVFLFCPPEVRYLQYLLWSESQTKSEHYKTYDLIPHMNFFHLFISWPPEPEVSDIWRSTNSRINRGLRMKLDHQQIYELIPKRTYFLWLYILTLLLKGGRIYICVYICAWDMCITCLITFK